MSERLLSEMLSRFEKERNMQLVERFDLKYEDLGILKTHGYQ